MALEIRRGKSKWWYGRVTINGVEVCKNLGVEIQGAVPNSLRQRGDAAFERSRTKAHAALAVLQRDSKPRPQSETGLPVAADSRNPHRRSRDLHPAH